MRRLFLWCNLLMWPLTQATKTRSGCVTWSSLTDYGRRIREYDCEFRSRSLTNLIGEESRNTMSPIIRLAIKFLDWIQEVSTNAYFHLRMRKSRIFHPHPCTDGSSALKRKLLLKYIAPRCLLHEIALIWYRNELSRSFLEHLPLFDSPVSPRDDSSSIGIHRRSALNAASPCNPSLLAHATTGVFHRHCSTQFRIAHLEEESFLIFIFAWHSYACQLRKHWNTAELLKYRAHIADTPLLVDDSCNNSYWCAGRYWVQLWGLHSTLRYISCIFIHFEMIYV